MKHRRAPEAEVSLGPALPSSENPATMPRREFLSRAGLASGALVALTACVHEAESHRLPIGAGRLRWFRRDKSRVFQGVSWDGEPLVRDRTPGLLDGGCRLLDQSPEQATWLGGERPTATHGPLRAELRHRLLRSGSNLGEDLLAAELIVRNTSDRPQRVELAFATSVQPSPQIDHQDLHVPLSAAGLSRDRRFAGLGVQQFLQDCYQRVKAGEFRGHYLEPKASYPDELETRALLLVPAVDFLHPDSALRVGLFTSSRKPRRFHALGAGERSGSWQVGRCVTMAPGQQVSEHCWLMLHEGEANTLWRAFHRFGHQEDHPPIDWTRAFRVHYYDFLASADGARGRRGGGFEADVPHFREFHVGLATQHGYYPWLGDYLHPDRKTWQAMRGDPQGPAAMSFDTMRARIQATRAAGAKAAIYLHPVLFDDAAPSFERMKDSVLVDAQGAMVPFPWQGPDTVGRNWRASLASPQWREHLLQQAQWIMEILQPDAITVDETFAGLGYDYHPNHAGPMSGAAIDFFRRLRSLVRSFGPDKAVFTSDCSNSSFVLWADGECGDHAYPSLLGQPLYAQEPVRYLAALGDKPWRPCAWHYQKMWELQMALARQVGAGVGVSNGWIEYTGLVRLPAPTRAAILADINSLFTPPSASSSRPTAADQP